MAVRGAQLGFPCSTAPTLERCPRGHSRSSSQQSRAWRQKRRASPAWTAIGCLILRVVALPDVTVLLLALAPPTTSGRTCLRRAAGLPARTLLLLAGVGALTLRRRHGTAWLVTMYRFPGRALARPAARHAAGGADLHHRLLLRRSLRLRRPRADGALRSCSAGQRARLLVSRTSARSAAPSSCVAAVLYPYVYSPRARLRAAVGVRARSRAHAGPHADGDLLGVALPLARPASPPAWRSS